MIDRACISLNNNCNLKCKYCHFQDKQNDFQSFTLEQLKTIVDNIHKYCLSNNLKKFKLGLVGSGEPMLKSNVILDLLTYIKDNNYLELNMYTITNGTLLTQDILKKFYDFNKLLKICISLDGYEELHNLGRNAYTSAMNGIANYKAVFGTMPSINATVNVVSYNNKDKLIAFFKENHMLDVTFSKLVGYFESDLFITNEQYNEFMEYAKSMGINSRQFRKEKCYDCTMYGSLCGVGRTNIFITPEGVYPCGRFYKNNKYLLGQYNTSVFEIEKNVSSMTPVEDGKCYFIENVEGK